MTGWRKKQIMEKQMENEEPLKIIFAPGAFDEFEGTQEELDALQKEIMDMFTGKSKEEILAMSRPLEDVEDLPDYVKEQIARGFGGEDTRKLQ